MELRQDNPLAILRWAIRSQGLVVTVLSFALKALALVGPDLTRAAWYRELRDRHIDRKFAIDTAGSAEPADLGVDQAKITEINGYQPSTPLAFHLIFSTLGIRHEQYTFIDIGSGKGRALFLAAEYPFKRIVGIELSKDLHEAASRNICTFRSRSQRCFDIRLVQQDATDFEFPDGSLVVYLNNPFHEAILGQVIERVRRSYADHPRHIVVVYFFPSHRRLLDGESFLTPVDFERALRGPVRRLMPVHQRNYSEAWVAIYETEQ